MKVEAELVNQITRLVISLVIVLQITPWILLLLGFFIMRQLERRNQTKTVNPQAKPREGGDPVNAGDQSERLHRR